MTWQVFRESDPYAHIVKRRFGPNFEKPCKRPTIVECARWECQAADEKAARDRETSERQIYERLKAKFEPDPPSAA